MAPDDDKAQAAKAYGALEDRLGHRFGNPALLEEALTHPSWVNELRGTEAAGAGGSGAAGTDRNNGGGTDRARPARSGRRRDSERLEFLGDAVLNLIASDFLMRRFPDRNEGELSKARAQMVSEPALARAAGMLGLGPWIFLGRGEEAAGGRGRPSILANVLEAVLGAVFVDGGFAAALRVAEEFLARLAEEADRVGHVDFKSRIQEQIQAHYREAPRYVVVAETGPGHARMFEVAIHIRGQEWGRALGRSKKEAEQAAAALALSRFERERAAGSPAVPAGREEGPEQATQEPSGKESV